MEFKIPYIEGLFKDKDLLGLDIERIAVENIISGYIAKRRSSLDNNKIQKLDGLIRKNK